MNQPEFIKITLGKAETWKGDLILTAGFFEGGNFMTPGKNAGDIRGIVSTDRTGIPRAVISLGAEKMINPETFRKAGGLAAQWFRKNELNNVAINAQSLAQLPVSFEQAFQSLCEGIFLGSFNFLEYKSAPEVGTGFTTVTFLINPEHDEVQLRQILNRSLITCQAVNLARSWAHEPPNRINPVTLAARVVELADSSGLSYKILDETELKQMGANAIVSVGQGSQTPSRLIVMEYPGQNADAKPIVLIGKAITFDTGGYSIKDRDGMVGMKYDKCAGMDVIALVKAAAELKIKTPVISIIAAAENMISGSAYRPNDIIQTLSGKTVEVISADAEGRMVLSDALTYAQRQYKPRAIINLATLTGGVVIALGRLRAGIMGNDDRLIADLIQHGEKTHERLWQLPLDEEYLELIKGDDSDIKNSGAREAHAIIGGIFLKQFVANEIPWAHIDIAGVAGVDKDMPYCPKGATGFGVRLLLNYLMQLE